MKCPVGQQLSLLLGPFFLASSCWCLSKNNDLDDMMAGDPSSWINPHSMADLDDLQQAHVVEKSDTNTGAGVQSETASRLEDLLQEIVEGQKTILEAIQSSNFTLGHKESCL
jgi:hypothetical protein